MKLRLSRTAALTFTVIGTSTLLAGAPAQAVDDVAPTPCNGTPLIKDAAGDQAASSFLVAQAPIPPNDNTDMLGVFLKHDPSKGAEATTVNVIVKDLKPALPQGATNISWTITYITPEADQMFVRAVYDFTGNLSFEYGDYVPIEHEETGYITSSSVYGGKTQGKLFEGPNGVVQIVIPQDRGGAAGTKLTSIYAFSGVARALPNATTTPTRGLSTQVDRAPDDDGVKDGAIEACAVAAAPAGETPVDLPPTDAPQAPAPGGGSAQPAAPQGQAPAVTLSLVTSKVALKKAKKSLALALRSSGALSRVAVTVKKGRAVVARGSLASLNGNGTAKLKVAKKLKKGAYTVTLAGTDAAGRAVSATGRLTVR